MENTVYKDLIQKALCSREQSYCPYSSFAVGAALLTEEGKVYTGANIESASFSPTVCGERVAFFTAVHNGETRFKAIAVVGGKQGEAVTEFCAPCGVCRQVMAEFCTNDFEIILFDGKTQKVITLGALLPASFTKTNMD
ncbi:MAG: cytidine deaminase [Clostridia bacterium]|nr:cytidine deaminase [Clostridia bacterium]